MFKQFEDDIVKRTSSYKNNESLQKAREEFHIQLVEAKYSYNFQWLGVPILQIPQDIQALQEIIWKVKPDLIIETGVAYGGSLIFFSSMLSLLEYCGEIKGGIVLGIEINLFKENMEAIYKHPFGKKIHIRSGSSTDKRIIDNVKEFAKNKNRVMVCLDSNHTNDHVLEELRAYAPLVTVGSYIVVEDTGVEDLPNEALFSRPWGKGNSPKTAVLQYLKENNNFEIDKLIDTKLIITANQDGYLRRVK